MSVFDLGESVRTPDNAGGMSARLLGAVFVGAIVVANLTATKVAFFDLPAIGGVAVPAGFVAVGVAFAASDLLAELHGPRVARDYVFAAVGTLVVAYLLVAVAVSFDAAPFYEDAEAFASVFGASTPIVTASIVVTLLSQTLDVTLYERLRTITDGRWLVVRNLGSTITSQLVDTAAFIVLGFVILPPILGGTTTPLAAVPGLVAAQWALKIGVAVADTPVVYGGVSLARRWPA